MCLRLLLLIRKFVSTTNGEKVRTLLPQNAEERSHEEKADGKFYPCSYSLVH